MLRKFKEEERSGKNKTLKEKYDYWTDLIKEWEESGLSKAEYCRRRSIKYGTFKWWGRHLKKRDKFLPVRILCEEESKKESSEIEIRLQGYLRIILKKDFEEDFLKKVIKSLEAYHV